MRANPTCARNPSILWLLLSAILLAAGCTGSGSGGGDGSADETPPTVTIQAPADGARVAGSVEIMAHADDDTGVDRVELSVDGTVLQAPAAPPYEATWDTTALADGSHTVRAVATDAAGNAAEASVTVSVDNTAPAIAFDAPADGATVSGPLAVTVSAADAGGLAGVDLTVAGSSQGTLATAPFAWTVDTTALADGDVELRATATDAAGNTAEASVTVSVDNAGSGELPPDPADVAPDLDPTVATSFLASTEFLYTGDDPIQTGVAPGTMEKRRVAAVRGRVIDRDANPVPGVTVSIHDHPELGQTLSRADGGYVLVVNGGGSVVVQFRKDGLLPVHRRVDVGWNEFQVLPDVVLIPLDDAVTAVALSEPGMKVVRGSPETDASGTRRATLLVPEGVSAWMELPDGSTRALDTLNVRATEYTVGDLGHETMPAELPPTTGYTYALEYTADEALAAGASRVVFSEPLIHYVEDFIGFPVGTAVPAGYYDPDRARWIPSDNGRVVRVVAVADGLAALDTDGDGAADDAATLAALGVTDAERAELAALYGPDQTLWRVPVPHFSPWDCNWPYGPPPDAVWPNQPEGPWWHPKDAEDDPCTDTGSSIIECQNRVLREEVPVPGTPVFLAYRSDRVPGTTGAYAVDIPVTGPTVPASLKAVELVVRVAGRSLSWRWDAAEEDLSGITQTVAWDGLDWLGSPLQGTVAGIVTITYVYDAVYYSMYREFERSFLRPPTAVWTDIFPDRAREQVRLVQIYPVDFYPYDQRSSLGLGGWSLSLHHRYDPQGQVLERGDGTRRTVGDVTGKMIRPVAGTGESGYDGDGGPAVDARLHRPDKLAVAADGSLYIADTTIAVVRRVAPDGTIDTVFDDQDPSSGLYTLGGVAVDGDGSLYVADYAGNRIWRKAPDGTTALFAGAGPSPAEGDCTTGGDDGPAVDAFVCNPSGMAFGPDGSLYVTEQTSLGRVRRIAPDGTITTVAGGGIGGDGNLATDAMLSFPDDVAVARDGSLYIAEGGNYRVRRVGTDGVITTVAGTGAIDHGGDGGPAAEAAIGKPTGVALDREGRLYIATRLWSGGYVRRVDGDGDGVISTIAGGGDEEGATWALRALLRAPQDVVVGPDETVIISVLGDHKVVRLVPPLPGITDDAFLVPSADGREYYRFDADGRHLATYNTLTSEAVYTFTYDGAGLLVAITDADGGETVIERAADGTARAIVGPLGDRTELEMDADGYLAKVTGPSGATTRFAYDADGLLVQYTDALEFAYTYSYDERGRLAQAKDPAGGTKDLARGAEDDTVWVTRTTGEELQSVYATETPADGGKILRFTAPDGTVRSTEVGPDGTVSVQYGDGLETTTVLDPDPLWGVVAPTLGTTTVTTPAGLRQTVTHGRSVALADPDDPLRIATRTDTVTVNGRTFTSTYDAASGRTTLTTPEGRQATRTIDGAGRTVAFQVADLAAGAVTYDAHGRVTAYTRGSGDDARAYAYAYGTDGRLAAVTDPLGHTVTVERDEAGRVTGLTYPDDGRLGVTRDLDGRVTAVTPPGRPAHGFTFTPVGLTDTYDPPGDGNEIGFSYDLDRRLTAVVLPGGDRFEATYDPDTGQLTEVAVPGYGTVAYGYGPGGQVDSVTGGGVTVGFAYDGGLPVSEGFTGPFDARVVLAYDDFRPAAETVAVGTQEWSVAYGYDDDGLLTAAGDLAYTRDLADGTVTGSTLGGLTTTRTHNGFAETVALAAYHGGTEVFSAAYQRDRLGRITGKTERLEGGTATTYAYAYDAAGRLTGVTESVGGTVTATYGYTYDTNGNRTSFTARDGTVTTATGLNDRDQLLGYGDAAYTYDPAGNRSTAAAASGTTTYGFDAYGVLRSVALPGGQTVAYVIDGLGRRVGKTVDGTPVLGFVYAGRRLVAELDAGGAVVSRFVYGARSGAPEYLVRGGHTYRILTDPNGSVRLVVDVDDGSVAQRIDYDPFGRVEQDTNPGFQPFGFAGGLYDPDTGLTRFGAREYDAETGRWMSPDPIGFRGGDPNLYAYVRNDPVNLVDPLGLSADTRPCDPWDWRDWLKRLSDLLTGGGDESPPPWQRRYPDLPDPREALDWLDLFAETVDVGAKLDEELKLGYMPEIPNFTGYVGGALRAGTQAGRNAIKVFDAHHRRLHQFW